MSKIRLHGTSSGYTEIVPKAAAASNTLTAPSTVGELIAKDAAGAIGITSVQATNANFSGTTRITSGISTTLRVTTGISTTLQVGGVNILNSDGVNTTGIVTATAFIPTVGQLSHRNLIINGGFQVHQRGDLRHSYSWAGDRFQNRTGSSTVISQSTTVPAGFANSMSLAASSGTATLQWNTLLEVGNNITGTNIGNYYSANSKWTISIWATVAVNVKVQFCNDFGAGDAQVIQASTAMTSTGETSNTFTRYKLTFDIASVTPHANNKGLQIHFATSSAASAIKYTGAQLERGTVATPFEHRSYSDDLRKCQRYYQTVPDSILSSGYGSANGYSRGSHIFVQTMRTNPTLSITETSSGNKIAQGSSKDGFYATFDGLSGTGASLFNFTADAEL